MEYAAAYVTELESENVDIQCMLPSHNLSHVVQFLGNHETGLCL